MAQRFYQRLVQGETVLIEARFVGEDLGDAVFRVEGGGGLPMDGFELSKPSSDTACVRNEFTSSWPVGLYLVRLWFDWQSGDLGSEVGLEMRFSVEASL